MLRGINMKGKDFLFIYVLVAIIIIVCLFFTKKILLVNVYYGITVWSAIYTILMKILESFDNVKRNKLKEAIRIVENFDNPELRKARNFTRLFKKDHDDENLQKGKLAKFINEELDNQEMQECMNKYNIKNSEEIQELKSSLVYLFNYFQSVYTTLEADMADKDYTLKSLCNVYLQLFDRFDKWIQGYCEKSDKNQYNDLKELAKMAKNFKEKYL